MKGGQYAKITGAELKLLRENNDLTQVEMAILARSSFKHGGRRADGQYVNSEARRVQAWESGKSRIPLSSWELICTKLKLLKQGVSFEDLEKYPLDYIISRELRAAKPLPPILTESVGRA